MDEMWTGITYWAVATLFAIAIILIKKDDL